jgi:hypothetical protein
VVALGEPLDHQVGHALVDPQRGRRRHDHARAVRGPGLGPLADPVDQHPGEQEQRHNRQAVGAEPVGAVERVLHRWGGHGHERRLDRAEAAAVAQQPGQLDELGARVGVGRAPADQHDRRGRAAVGRERGDRPPGPVLRHGQHGRVGAEVAGQPERDGRVAAPGPAEHRRAVVLEVAGAEQDVGHGHDVGGPRRDQVVDGTVDRRVGQLEEAAAHPTARQPGRHQVAHGRELPGRGRVA